MCCGTKRLVEIDCPQTCVYLSSAKAHPAAVVQRRHERDLGFLLPFWTDLPESHYRLLLLFQAITLKHASTALPAIVDEDVAEAAAVTAATLETARSGIIYDHQAASIPAQRLSAEYKRTVEELGRQPGAPAGARVERDSAAVLRRLEQMARKAAGALPGDEPPVFLKLMARVMSAGEKRPATEKVDEGGGDDAPRLIIPG